MKEEHKTNNFNNTEKNSNSYKFKYNNNFLQNEQTQNFMKFFFTYDYMKFQQLIKTSSSLQGNSTRDNNFKNFTHKNKLKTCKSNIYRNRNFNSTIRFINRKTKRQGYTYTSRGSNNYNMYNNFFNSQTSKNKSNTIKDDADYEMNFNLEDDIRDIRSSQKETDLKLDLLIKHLIPNVKTLSNNFDIRDNIYNSCVKYSFGFEIHGNGNGNVCNNFNNINGNQNMNMNLRLSSEHQQLYDYFSFKIKPDLTLSTGDLRNSTERKSLASRKNKGLSPVSPDRLISHKFFEDSENFRNTNLMSVKTFMNNNNNTHNPFCMTDKSACMEGLIDLEEKNLANIFSSDTKLENDNDDNDLNEQELEHEVISHNFRKRKLTNFTSENKKNNSHKNLDKEFNAFTPIHNASNFLNTHTDRENSFTCLKDDMSSIANYSERDIDININIHSTDKKANTMNNKSEKSEAFAFNSIKINNFHISEEESNTSLRSNQHNITNKIHINEMNNKENENDNEKESLLISSNQRLRNSKLNKENINNNNTGNKSNKSVSSNKLITASERDNIMNTLNTISISVNNDSVSMSSSKINVDGSNDRKEMNRKVRGFNFKNNINTKKFNKPLLNSQMSNVENSSNLGNPLTLSSNVGGLIHNKLIDSNNLNKANNLNSAGNFLISNSDSSNYVNKSSNLDDKLKIKKFNFNNNINIKKFIRNNDTGIFTGVPKEREKQYAVEIEESDLGMEGNGISISDLTDK